MITSVRVRDDTVLSPHRLLDLALRDGFVMDHKGVRWPYMAILGMVDERLTKHPSMSMLASSALDPDTGVPYVGARQSLLKYLAPWTGDLGAGMWFPTRGTWVHTAVEHINPPAHHRLVREERMFARYDGVLISGQIDLYFPDTCRLVDTKSTIHKLDNLPLRSHVNQVNGYAWLLEENDYPVEEMQLHYFNFYAAHMIEVPWLTPDEMWKVLDGVHVFQAGLTKWSIPGIKTCGVARVDITQKPCSVCPLSSLCQKLYHRGEILPHEHRDRRVVKYLNEHVGEDNVAPVRIVSG